MDNPIRGGHLFDSAYARHVVRKQRACPLRSDSVMWL
jgi:hypothetical protein